MTSSGQNRLFKVLFFGNKCLFDITQHHFRQRLGEILFAPIRRVAVQLLLVAIALMVENAYAQIPQREKPDLRFQHLNINLNNSRIESLIQDSYGYIWIGTLSGLYKYDGVGLSLYLSSDDTTSIDGNRAGSLFEDSKKRLWIGTEKGISYYDRKQDHFIRTEIDDRFVDPSDPTPNRIGSIVEDKDGSVWIASERAGLLRLDEKKNVFVSFFNDKDGGKLEDTPVISLCPDKDNRLWVGTTIGLFDLDTKTGAALFYTHDAENFNSIAGNYVEDIILDRNENLWIATHEYGLDKLVNRNGENRTFVHYRSKLDDVHSLTNNDVTTVYEDSTGKIWICNENGGLHLYNPANDNFFRFVPDPADPFSVSNISVKVIFEDRQGRLWVGSNLEGIDVVDKYETTTSSEVF